MIINAANWVSGVCDGAIVYCLTSSASTLSLALFPALREFNAAPQRLQFVARYATLR